MRDFKLFLKLFDDGCIDNNIVPFDGCYSNNYDCIQGCRNCIKGICQNCLDGFWYQEQTQICIPQCGDSIITLNEECDDGNKIGYDGCYECKYQCSQNCEKCQFGKCLECQVEYQLDFYKIKCIPKCGDDVITSQELFDDGNNIQFDGYHKCLNYCQIECLLCFDNKCYNCQEGWQLQEYQCIQICGDSEQYQIPYQMNNGKCLPICGDNIITPIFEQCDDGNDIPYDGCFQCLYSCSYGCIQCEKDNHCLLCEDQNYILDTQTFQCNLQQQNIETNTEVIINDNDQLIVQCNKNQAFIQNKCVNLCGNGILKSEFEQCDDGNNNGGDGCSALCFQEDSYECNNQENQLSICTFIQTPNFNLILLSDKQNQTKIIELIFSQQVYISSKLNFEQIIEFIILNEIQIAFSLIPFQNITSQLSNPKYKILIQFLEPVANPILKVTIQKYSIFNSYDMELNNNQIQLQLGTPFVLSEATQKRVNQIIQMNDAVIYTTVGIAGFLFLTVFRYLYQNIFIAYFRQFKCR
ncbi:unnamed protein product [Paramecium sonneborni]|uniref:Uncharacterized protein n=1 Tax=Paramecium sonneborni TaxID=65129 RepID=A0A8S1RBR9_9CILI|nr:unnamed protein product [Paramecium sonneborni]